MKVLLSLALVAALVSPVMAEPISQDRINAVVTQSVQSDLHGVHAKRDLTNGAFAVAQIVETVVDCGQTRRILSRGPLSVENDPVTRAIHVVTTDNVTRVSRLHPGRCLLAGGLAVGAEFAIFHRSSPVFMGTITALEAANIQHNAGVEKR